MAAGRCDLSLQKDMVSLQAALNRMAYASRDFSYVVRGEGKVHYMFALLFQRAVYFITDFSQSPSENCTQDAHRLEILSVFLNTCLLYTSTQQLAHHAFNIRALCDTVRVSPVAAHDVIVRIQRVDAAGGRRFLTDRKVRRPVDKALHKHFVYAFLKRSGTEHLIVDFPHLFFC